MIQTSHRTFGIHALRCACLDKRARPRAAGERDSIFQQQTTVETHARRAAEEFAIRTMGRTAVFAWSAEDSWKRKAWPSTAGGYVRLLAGAPLSLAL